jgi:tripartite-type tricarboxylate transporter receptor subunit TctC
VYLEVAAVAGPTTGEPGGSADVFGRIIAQKLSEQIGKQFYVENMRGAGGNVGMGRAALAAPDGYTILVVFRAT